MIKRVLPESQTDLFDKPVLYLSQADVADFLGVTVRMIQYWEMQGLLHPEQPQNGRQRRYTKNDLVELSFIKSMLVEHGYTVPSLKEKLAFLQAPYYYNASEIYWDIAQKCWLSGADIACKELSEKKELLSSVLANTIAESVPDELVGKLALGLLRTVENCLKGKTIKTKKLQTKKRRSRRQVTPAPLFQEAESVKKDEKR